jgi:release factor glutamine methyltransferase
MNTARAAFLAVRQKLMAAGIPEPEAKARVIISHVLEVSLNDVLEKLPVNDVQAVQIQSISRRCAEGEPVEYATGKAYFRYIELAVTPVVLIPRQETELVAEAAIDRIKANEYKNALDIGTGSGCIAISLATETKASVEACDISEAALRLAAQNAKANGVPVRFFLSDMFSCITGKYDLIISNPPYISNEEYKTLDSVVRDYEPKLALTAGDGLDCYRVIAQQAGQHINPGGALVLEIGMTQGEDVTALLAAGGFSDIELKQDYSGRDRIVTARK